MLASSLVTRTCLKASRGLISGTIALLFEKYSPYFMTFLAGSQVSDRCPLGYLFLTFYDLATAEAEGGGGVGYPLNG